MSLAEDSELFSFADIESVVNAAVRKAHTQNAKLSQGFIYEQILKTTPSITPDGLSRYFKD